MHSVITTAPNARILWTCSASHKLLGPTSNSKLHSPQINIDRRQIHVLQVWDIRSMKRTGEIPHAHLMPVRDIDFANQQQHKIVSAGDDCKLCIWDLRYASPLNMAHFHGCDFPVTVHTSLTWHSQIPPPALSCTAREVRHSHHQPEAMLLFHSMLSVQLIARCLCWLCMRCTDSFSNVGPGKSFVTVLCSSTRSDLFSSLLSLNKACHCQSPKQQNGLR